ncbi:MAG: hypothetical protein C6P37_01775 [Caldibacillus debilis]|uniref:Uncharacterized protein n=1 Tax=Caldibacillus debilis TaxID=301148 RepID=A0A3E0K8G0_9BACI|nr:MAG: hypothetical protein BAA03_02615 [Caldibacillus debilis]REJ18776.1 MAG: hypothetical protein C6W57_02690 [Caldibacillus debilis]REJ27288.1 MAG: hypothetical protein C6W56_10835 [Caldibacillus debilis]REJ31090.1 MAG: hypothetical protein C6P37_01775 [Caldibacillus debilis]
MRYEVYGKKKRETASAILGKIFHWRCGIKTKPSVEQGAEIIFSREEKRFQVTVPSLMFFHKKFK